MYETWYISDIWNWVDYGAIDFCWCCDISGQTATEDFNL